MNADDLDAEIARLAATVARQRGLITAFVEAGEQRPDRSPEESALVQEGRRILAENGAEARTQRIGVGERLLRSVVDSLDARMCILNGDGTIIGTNRLWDDFVASMGWSLDQAGIGADVFALVRLMRGELKTRLDVAIREVMGSGSEQLSVKGYLPIGTRGEDVVVRLHPVNDHEVARAVVTMIDITDATRMQRELRRVTDEAQLLALVAQHTDNAVVIADVDGRIEWANNAFCRLSGYASHELLGLQRLDLLQGSFRDTPAFERFAEALVQGRGAQAQFPSRTKDGGFYWVHIEAQPIFENGRTARFISVERDITAQRAADEKLRAAIRRAELLAEQLNAEKALLSGVLGSIPHLVYWKDSALRYMGVNPAFLQWRGFADQGLVLERTESGLGEPDELSAVLAAIEPQVLATGAPALNQRVLLSGSDDPVAGRPATSVLLSVLPQTDDEGRVCGVIGVAADVTHVTMLEQQVAQATRLESIGQLAAGIAHEINTPVQYVSDNTRFVAETFAGVLTALRAAASLTGTDDAVAGQLREVLADVDIEFLAEEIPSALSQSQEGLERVAQIVRAMKDFSHPGHGRTEADLNRAVESTIQVSRNEWRYVAELEATLDPDVGLVRCFEGELKQVLLNIVVNAAQAIAGGGDKAGGQALGHIKIRTQRREDGVRITVSDDGPGMDEAVRQKIFDPFFTTKAVGKGTGQGLSMAYAVIVQKHGGKLMVSSTPGEGSTFTIDLADEPDGTAA